MRDSAFPDAAAHAAVHAEHVAELHKLRKELAQNGLSPLFRLWFGSRFTGWMRAQGKLGGQHKVPRVIADPVRFADAVAGLTSQGLGASG